MLAEPRIELVLKPRRQARLEIRATMPRRLTRPAGEKAYGILQPRRKLALKAPEVAPVEGKEEKQPIEMTHCSERKDQLSKVQENPESVH
jgi:hypothetical protein